MLDLARLLGSAGGLEGVADTGAVDENPLLPVRRPGFREPRVDAFVGGHVDIAEQAADLRGDRLALFGIAVEYRDLHALLGECPRGGRAEPGCGTGHDCAQPVQLHVLRLQIR